MDYLEVVLRTLFAIALLLLLARLDGSKQISQLSFYDYIVGITSGSIAASMCFELDDNVWFYVIALTLFMLSSMLISFITTKSIRLRRLLTGKPTVLIASGKLLYDGLRKSKFDVNDLMRELRAQGYFDLSTINYAVLETSGMLSVLPKASSRPATTEELELEIEEDGINSDVIIDGKIIPYNLKAFNKDKTWILAEVERQGAKLKDVLIGTLNPEGQLSLYYKEKGTTTNTVFQ